MRLLQVREVSRLTPKAQIGELLEAVEELRCPGQAADGVVRLIAAKACGIINAPDSIGVKPKPT